MSVRGIHLSKAIWNSSGILEEVKSALLVAGRVLQD